MLTTDYLVILCIKTKYILTMKKFQLNLVPSEKILAINVKILYLESEKSSQETIFRLEQLNIDNQIDELERQLLSFERECAESKEGHFFLIEESASEEAAQTIHRCQKCGAWSR